MTCFRNTRLYKILLWIVLILSLVLVGQWSARVFLSPALLEADDFVQYWSAGRLNLLRVNPYDPEQLRPLQYEAGRTAYAPGVATIVWNPPWTMPLLMPFGALTYPTGRVVWFMGSFALLAACSIWVWRRYEGPKRLQWVAWAAAFTFMPALVMLRVGQIGIFLLAGVLGILSAATKRQWVGLGAWVILLSIKPQLVYLLLVVLLLWLIERRQFIPIVSGAGVLALTVGVALCANPAVVQQYFGALGAYPPVEWATPTLGSVLRLIFGPDKFWLPLIPLLAGLIWAALYWLRRRHIWDWTTEMPLLVLMSLVTTIYTWTYDLVILLLPLVAVLACLLRQKPLCKAKGPVIVYVLLNVVMLLVQRWGLSDFWFVWVAPAWLAWYLWARARVESAALAEGVAPPYGVGEGA